MAKILAIALTTSLLCCPFVSAAPSVVKIPLFGKTISLDPTGVQDQSSLWVSRQVNCQLVRQKGRNIALDAAASFAYKSPLLIEIKIRDEARFVDGSPVTASDVIATLDFLKDSRKVLRNIFEWIKEVKEVDQKTIAIALTTPVPQFQKYMAAPNYSLFKKEFLERARKEPALWENPLGCGNYKIAEHKKGEKITLTHIKTKSHIEFYFSENNQLEQKDMVNYDIIGLPIMGMKINPTGFKKVSIFDPYQIFWGFNTKLPEWQDKAKRCQYMAKFDPSEILKTYGDIATPANDFFPRGVLGYSENINYKNSFIAMAGVDTHKLAGSVCLSFLEVSIPKNFREAYAKSFKKNSASVKQTTIENPKRYAETFRNSGCDILVLGLKSNYLDAYEYLLSFAEDKANLTGYDNAELRNIIKSSQGMDDQKKKSQLYQSASKIIQDSCTIYPVLTMPMKFVWVREGLNVPGIGEGPLNEYSLGDVTW